MVSPSKGLVLTTSGTVRVRPRRGGTGHVVVYRERRADLGPGGARYRQAPYWDLSAAGFAWSSQDQWWGVVEGSAASPQETIDTGGTWRHVRRFPMLNEVQVVDPHVVVGWQEKDNGTAYTALISVNGLAFWRRLALPPGAVSPAVGSMPSLAFVNAHCRAGGP